MADVLIQEAWDGKPLSCFVVDSHCHIGEAGFTVIDPGAGALVRAMDRIGVDVAVVNSIPGCMGGQIVEGNNEVIAAVEQYRGRIFGLITVDPHHPDKTRNELRRGLDAGLRGVKIHDQVGLPYNHPNYEVVWEFAQENKLPLLAHTWGRPILDHLMPRFTDCPDVTWVLAHAGAVDRELYVDIARAHPNVYLELCASPCPRGMVEHFVEAGLSDRVLFGSDATFMCPAPQVGRVVFARISIEDKRKILGENARRAWGM